MSGFSNFELIIFHFLSLLGHIFVWSIIFNCLINRIRLFLTKLREKHTIYVFCAKDEKISCLLGVIMPLLVFAFHVTFIVNNPMLFSAKFHSFFLIYSAIGILLIFIFFTILFIQDKEDMNRLNAEIEQLRRKLDSTLETENNG